MLWLQNLLSSYFFNFVGSTSTCNLASGCDKSCCKKMVCLPLIWIWLKPLNIPSLLIWENSSLSIWFKFYLNRVFHSFQLDYGVCLNELSCTLVNSTSSSKVKGSQWEFSMDCLSLQIKRLVYFTNFVCPQLCSWSGHLI